MGLINMARGIVNTAKRERWICKKAIEISKMFLIVPAGTEYIAIMNGSEFGRYKTEKEAFDSIKQECFRIAEDLYRTEPRQSKPKYI